MSAYERKVMERYLTESEEKKLFDLIKKTHSLNSERDFYWMILIRMTGIRCGSLSKLTATDARIALEKGSLALTNEISKGGKGYTVYINKTAKDALSNLLTLRKQYGPTDSNKLILSTRGKGLSPRRFREIAQEWGEKAGIPGFSPHWLRHTIAKRIIKNSTAQNPLGIVKSVLGHSNINSTSIYTIPDKEEIRDAMRQVQ